MNEPLDAPDSCDPEPDPEVKRLKEDVRALKRLLREAAPRLEELHVFIHDGFCWGSKSDGLKKLQDKIDAELNG